MVASVWLIIIIAFAVAGWHYVTSRRQDVIDVRKYKSYVHGNATLTGKNVHFFVIAGHRHRQYCEITGGRLLIHDPHNKIELFINEKEVTRSGVTCGQQYVGTMIINEHLQFTYKVGAFSRYRRVVQQELPRANDLVDLVSFALETIMANNTMRKKNMLIGAAMPTSEAEFLHTATTFQHYKAEAGRMLTEKVGNRFGRHVDEYLQIFEFESTDQVSADELRRRYRIMAKRYHPDSPTGDVHKFKRVKEAYEHIKKEHVAV
ncbi:J domain-containing protein [Geomicrobium sp. JCM 19039]|uniref:J domain-containing protein n=2 Tax=unclassified Geomicrobium TaxID=2628951 RepID=UPI00045F35B7|nr:J domain-containing protein [Geomicrobium sp. JCM 19039]GAK14579.1 hypothetical protein JCM19039_4513 [Geomicrobium sp. JCM 19039]